VPWVHVIDWGELAAVLVGTTAMAALSYINSKSGRLPASVFLVAALGLVTLLSRLAGPALFTPLVAAGIALSQASRRKLLAHTWVIYAWTAVALLLPITLEATGVLAQTSRMIPEGLLLTGRIINSYNRIDQYGLLVGSVLLAVLVVAYATSLARDRYVAQRRLHIQAWHLHQLLPSHRRPASSI